MAEHVFTVVILASVKFKENVLEMANWNSEEKDKTPEILEDSDTASDVSFRGIMDHAANRSALLQIG